MAADEVLAIARRLPDKWLAPALRADVHESLTSSPSGVADRTSAPHAKQPHMILPLGAQILEKLFAGFRQELLDAGCRTFDEVNDTPAFGRQGWRARGDSDVERIAFRRSLLEHVIRERSFQSWFVPVSSPAHQRWRRLMGEG
jgi:hypothetical protein